MPALPLHEAGPYVAAAYIVVFALVLIYVAIMSVRLTRMQRRLGELLRSGERERRAEELTPSPAGESGAARPPGEEGALASGGGESGGGELDVGRPERTPA
jgi:CcmD family protein